MLKYVEKINSFDSFRWSENDHVQALYNYSVKGLWNENLDFLMLADELANLERDEKSCNDEILHLTKAREKEKKRVINLERQFNHNREPLKNLREFRQEKTKINRRVDRNKAEHQLGLKIIKELKVQIETKENELNNIQEKLTKTKQEVFRYIHDNIINVSGKSSNEWLETYSSNQSDINLDCIKIFIPRIMGLVDGGLREFINSKENESQDITIHEHVKPLSSDIINAHSAQENIQQQQQQSIRRNSFFPPEPEEKNSEQLDEKNAEPAEEGNSKQHSKKKKITRLD